MGGRSGGHEQEEQEHESQRSHQRMSRTVRTTLRRFPLRSLIPIDTCVPPSQVTCESMDRVIAQANGQDAPPPPAGP